MSALNFDPWASLEIQIAKPANANPAKTANRTEVLRPQLAGLAALASAPSAKSKSAGTPVPAEPTWHATEHDGGLAFGIAVGDCPSTLEEWHRGLDWMRDHSPPTGFRDRDWHQWKLDARTLLIEHGPQAAEMGWRTEELFGFHREYPAARVVASGLARFIHGGAVIEITDQFARIRRRSGAVLTYRRIAPQPGTIPAWELQPHA